MPFHLGFIAVLGPQEFWQYERMTTPYSPEGSPSGDAPRPPQSYSSSAGANSAPAYEPSAQQQTAVLDGGAPGGWQSPKPASGIALAALIVGIVAFLLGLIPVVGILAGLAAVGLGIFALVKKQRKAFAITGLVLGAIALLSSIVTTSALGSIGNDVAAVVETTTVTAPAEPSVEAAAPVETAAPVAAPEPVVTAEPVATPEAVVTPEPAAPAAPAVPAEYNSALTSAQFYASEMDMSKLGIYDQLTSEYGGQFTAEAAQYAVDNVQADWNANALASAKFYQDSMAMSPAAIHDQLTSEYGGQFTVEEADYAIANLNA